MIGKDRRRLRKVCRNYELVENYEKAIADEENKWDLHHRNEIDEMKSRQQLIDEGKYYDVDPSELIFLSHGDHIALHCREMTEETKRKMSEACKGKMFSEETRKKLSEAMKGKTRSEETRKKISKSQKGHIVLEETRNKISEAKMGHIVSEASKKKMSEAKKDKRWWNNGKYNKFSKVCPGEGFVCGRLKFNK